MQCFAILQSPPLSVVFLCSCDKVYHKQNVFFLCLLGQNVTRQYYSSRLG